MLTETDLREVNALIAQFYRKGQPELQKWLIQQLCNDYGVTLDHAISQPGDVIPIREDDDGA